MAGTKRAGILVVTIVFAIVVSGLYAIIYAAPHIEGIGIKTTVVQYEELPIADTVTALFVRDEKLFTAAYAGRPDYLIEEGTKIRAGTPVMYIESGGEPDTGSGTEQAAAVGEADAERAAYEKMVQMAKTDAEVSEGGVSPQTAIVSYYGDGWERKITPENIMTLPRSVFDEVPAEAIDLKSDYVRADDPVYRITNNRLWRVAFWIDDADKTILDKYAADRMVTLDLGTTKVRATVESAEPRGRDIFVVLCSDMYYKDLDKYRMRELSVVFSEVSGAVIERQDVKLKNGQTGVYVKQQSGTYRWIPVNVLKESGGRYLVSETSFIGKDGNNVSTIRYYDEIMCNPTENGY